MSTDPDEEDYPSLSPYAFAANSPILFVDKDGCGPDGPPWLEVLSSALDFVPGVGTVKNWVEAAAGYDMAGNKLEGWERIAMIAPGGRLVTKGAKVVKMAIKHADDIVKHVDDFVRGAKKVWSKIDNAVVSNQRKKAVSDAWILEKKMVEQSSRGTRDWSLDEMEELLRTGRVNGYVGHHINNVKHHTKLAGNSDNIKFLTRPEHYDVHHGGRWRKETNGKLVFRPKKDKNGNLIIKPKKGKNTNVNRKKRKFGIGGNGKKRYGRITRRIKHKF